MPAQVRHRAWRTASWAEPGTSTPPSWPNSCGRWAGLVAADPSLSDMFDGGLDDLAVRIRNTPLQAALDAFLADHGHRGNDEYELATPAWVMDPTPVYAAIDRLRRAPADRDPILIAERLAAESDAALAEAARLVPRRLRWMLRRCAMVSRQGSIGRERAKDILVLENLGARRVLHELVRRAAERGGPDDVRQAFCVTATELADFVARPTEFAEVIAEAGRPTALPRRRGSHHHGSTATSPTPPPGRCAPTPVPLRPPPAPRSPASASAAAAHRVPPA